MSEQDNNNAKSNAHRDDVGDDPVVEVTTTTAANTASAPTAKNDKDNSESDKKKKKPQQTLNSYLKLIFDDESVNKMHKMALSIQEASRKSQEEKPKKQKHRKKRPLSFKPRSLQSLHMTLFFGGENLCALPPEELQAWHTQITDIIASATQGTPDNDIETNQDHKDEFTLQFQELALFPPRRHTLIVAIFDASPKMISLREDILQMSAKSSKLLKEATTWNKEQWIPHITIGNIMGGRRGDVHKVKDDWFSAGLSPLEEKEEDGILLECIVKGVTMGGPVPDQLDLDWNFDFEKKQEISME